MILPNLGRWRCLLACFGCMLLVWQTLQGQDTLYRSGPRISVPPGITDIEADGEGNLFLLRPSAALLYKALQDMGYDSLVVVGGRSARSEGMLYPVKIAVKNRQNLYLLDEGLRRVALFNTNLRLSGEVKFTQLQRGSLPFDLSDFVPVSFDVGPAGEVFLLNQIDNRILKINAFGEYETLFGGLDYGKGSLLAPTEIAVNDKNEVFVSDTLNRVITVFDLFGIYRFSLRPDCQWARMQTVGNQLLLFDKGALWQLDPAGGGLRQWFLEGRPQILDVAPGPAGLFVLTENGVSLYVVSRP